MICLLASGHLAVQLAENIPHCPVLTVRAANGKSMLEELCQMLPPTVSVGRISHGVHPHLELRAKTQISYPSQAFAWQKKIVSAPLEKKADRIVSVMRNRERRNLQPPELEGEPCLENFPVSSPRQSGLDCFGGVSVGKERKVAPAGQSSYTTGMVVVLMGEKDGVEIRCVQPFLGQHGP